MTSQSPRRFTRGWQLHAAALSLLALTCPLRSEAFSEKRETPQEPVTGRNAANVASQLYAVGDLEGAVDILMRALETDPKDVKLRFMLANALYRMHDWESSIHHYREVLRLQPTNVDANLSLGFSLYHNGEPAKALAAWRRVSQVMSDDSLAEASLAIGLAAVGRLAEARHRVERAANLDPDWRRRLSIDVRWTPEMVRTLISLLDQPAGM